MNAEAPLILVDVDGTLIDAAYKHNASLAKLRSTVKKLQRRGVHIGLFSDTPYRALALRVASYGMVGPNIAEHGALMVTETGRLVVCNPFFRGTQADVMLAIRDQFIAMACGTAYNDPTTVIVGDVAALSTHPQPVRHGNTKANQLVLVNGLRTHSVSFYVRGYERTQETTSHQYVCVKNSILLQKYILQLKMVCDRFELTNQVWLDVNDEHCLCILHHRDTTKPTALRAIRATYPNSRIFMIGNSASDDLLDNEDAVVQCAVNNASFKYRNICKLQASSDYTAGVIELLEQISTLF